MRKAKSVTHPITMEHKGTKYSGTYTVESGTVSIDFGMRHVGPTQISGLPESTARILFYGLLDRFRGERAAPPSRIKLRNYRSGQRRPATRRS